MTNHAMKKEELFKTAFSSLYNSYVAIERAHTDDAGQYIFTCRVPDKEGTFLFRKEELTEFCL